MGVFLLECREDEGRQANFAGKEASSSILETMASFTDGATFNTTLMVSTSIIIVFL